MRMIAAVASLLLVLGACTEEAGPRPTFFASENPGTLSAWGVVARQGDQLVIGEGVLPYALNSPLFTDYAHKIRTVWTGGGEVSFASEGVGDFPVGTVISKTFYYPYKDGVALKQSDAESFDHGQSLALAEHRLIETRLLVHREDGWHPISYVWNEVQTEARLKRTGAVVPVTLASDEGLSEFAYVVPNEIQCAACHAPNATTKVITPLGPTAAQLDRPYDFADGPKNQLTHWADKGVLGPVEAVTVRMPAWADKAEALDARARGYLASNCAHCHNPQGPADTSGLDLTLTATGPALGRCKPPIAAGSGTGGRKVDIMPGDAEASILTYRVASTDPGAMMPELGRGLAHEEGAALLRDWINAMDGTCG